MEAEIIDRVKNFIKNSPKMSFKKFKKISNIKINECYYYQIRREIFPGNKRSNSVSKSLVYINITSIPNIGFSPESKQAIKIIINAINNANGSKMEVLENLLTNTIEIRQVGV